MERFLTLRFVMLMPLMLAAGGGCRSESGISDGAADGSAPSEGGISGGAADGNAPTGGGCSPRPTGWASMSTTGEPRTRMEPVMAWTGQELLVVSGWWYNDEP